MKPERWKRVDALLSAALERKGQQRTAFLAQACEGDEELQKQVQALLGAYDSASSFLETPPSDMAAALAENHSASSLAQTATVLASDSAAQTTTQPGQAIGTLLYMSPEQLKGEPIDARTDLWSLGVVAYELFSGFCPFKSDSNAAIVTRIIHDEPPSLATVPNIPTWLADLVSKLLRKNRVDRLQSATELLNRLNDLPIAGKTPFSRRPALTNPPWRSYRLPLLVLGTVALATASSVLFVRHWHRWFASGGPSAIRAWQYSH